MTDHNEAMRLADEVRVVADRLQYTPGGFYGVETVGPLNQAAALLRQLSAERDQLRAEVERLRADAERLDWLEQHDGRFHNLDRITSIVGVGFIPAAKPDFKAKTLRAAIDAARTTHKETE